MQALSYLSILKMVIDKLYTQQEFLSCALAGMLIQSMLCSACQQINMTYNYYFRFVPIMILCDGWFILIWLNKN